MRKFVRWFWTRIEGNALWDAIKWIVGKVSISKIQLVMATVLGIVVAGIEWLAKRTLAETIGVFCAVFGVIVLVFIFLSVRKIVAHQRTSGLSDASMGNFSGTLSAIRMKTSTSGLLRTPSGPGGRAPLLTSRTTGQGKQNLEFGMRPVRIMFYPSGQIIDEDHFGKPLRINGQKITVLAFTETGVRIDDHGVRLDIQMYMLD